MAKLATYYIENHKIEIIKTLFGKEKVLLNGITVSEKPSGATTDHQFIIDKNRFRISKREPSAAEKMNAFEILRNGSPIALINIESQTSIKIFMLIIAIGVGLGFMVGVLVYNMMLA
ncbi:MAG: hypothetical protein WBG48_10570 [Pricia sp.]